VILAGERVHRPADRHTDQQEQKERPDDVFHAVNRTAAAQKTEGHRNDQCEERHGLEVRELESHGSFTLSCRARLHTRATPREGSAHLQRP